MTYALVIGDRTYSSWSLRSWLLIERFEIPCSIHRVHLDSDEFLAELAGFAPARTVPALRLPDGTSIFDTIAIAETLAERHDGLWPAAASARARARAIVAAMHSGFAALRSECPMNLRRAYAGYPAPASVRADLERIEALWRYAGEREESEGWLFGAYSIADAFYAPVAARIATYDLPVGARAAAYVARTLADPAFRRWRAMGQAERSVHVDCDLDLPPRPWPGPAPIEAAPATDGAPVNARCPFSHAPVVPEALARVGGTLLGFCNTFCRDKVVADPEAWPEAMALLDRPLEPVRQAHR